MHIILDQVQMTTRSGTNQYKGALFWTNRNPVWDSNTFSNNFNHVEKPYLNRNQFGARLGGPIIKNKPFFFFVLPQLFTTHVWNDQGASLTSTPLWTYGDTLSWTRGKHAFKRLGMGNNLNFPDILG